MSNITQNITTLPDAPDPAIDSAEDFSIKAAASVVAQKGLATELQTWTTQVNVIAEEVNANMEVANEINSLVNTFTNQVNAVKWVSGTTYTAGAAVWSPVNGLSYRRKTTGAGTTDPSSDSTNWWQITNTVFSDALVSGVIFKDCGYKFLDKGNSGTVTQTVDFSAATHQRIKATGAFTIAFSNWPPSGNFGEVLLELEADGTARVITLPVGTKFLTSSGAVTTTFADLNVTLQSSDGAIDWLIFFTRDAGSTLYCKVVR